MHQFRKNSISMLLTCVLAGFTGSAMAEGAYSSMDGGSTSSSSSDSHGSESNSTDCPTGTVLPTLTYSPKPFVVSENEDGGNFNIAASPASQNSVTYAYEVSNPAMHDASISYHDGHYSYAPPHDYKGQDQFSVRLKVLKNGVQCSINGEKAQRLLTVPVWVGIQPTAVSPLQSRGKSHVIVRP